MIVSRKMTMTRMSERGAALRICLRVGFSTLTTFDDVTTVRT